MPVLMPLRALLACAAASALLCACGGRARVHPPAPVPSGAVETGIASWYGRPYHGRPAASGEIYDMNQLTAAHRTLPFGTRVRVRSLESNKVVDVRINDRGPFVEGRILDLSWAAARALGLVGPGTARVRLEVLAVGAPAPNNAFAVQVGAFRDRANAERLRKDMERRYGFAILVARQGEPVLWRVLVGRVSTLEAAAELAARIHNQGRGKLGSSFVVRLDP